MNKQTVADSPSLRLRLAKPGPWLLDSSEELVKEARGKEDARGASQLSGGRKHNILVRKLIDASLSSLPVFCLPFYFHPLLIPLPLSVFFILNFLSFNQQARKALEPVVSISLRPRFISEPSTPAEWERLSFTHGLYCPPAKQDTWVQALGQEGPLEEEMATHSTILPGKSHGQRSYNPGSPKESDVTEQLCNKNTAVNTYTVANSRLST